MVLKKKREAKASQQDKKEHLFQSTIENEKKKTKSQKKKKGDVFPPQQFSVLFLAIFFPYMIEPIGLLVPHLRASFYCCHLPHINTFLEEQSFERQDVANFHGRSTLTALRRSLNGDISVARQQRIHCVVS
ncbi:hypothetical protein CEXT_351411 [Caerostris extrusa]|uniref:Uncharacterized protein n=1 Tax=Caerostris extrusa TaxID=172846 RepID=A0AAV4RNY8_CAEEX|nr:hypothetical protein CEXT_351411 [Caerostris extrusa]